MSRKTLRSMSSGRSDFAGGNNQDNGWMGGVFLAVIIIAVLAALCAIPGCSPKNLPPVHESTTEESSVSYKDSTVWRDTTIYVPIPLEKWQVVASVKDTAKAETSVAKAAAYLDSLGFMHLDLQNKPVQLKGVVSIPHRTIMVNATSKKEQIKPLVVQVEKPLSWWQKFRIGAFWWLCAILLALAIWTFRKPLLKLLKLCIPL